MKELLWQSRAEASSAELDSFPGLELPSFAEPVPLPEASSDSPDLRSFIEKLGSAGRLLRVKETVDWKFGVGRWARSRNKPLLFEKLHGYAKQRLFTNGLADPACIQLALGFELGIRWSEVIADVRDRLARPVQPKVVRNGPVLENVVPASALDLQQFPVPHWSTQDAGRYLGTWHLNITRDPENGKRNVGLYRMQLLGSKRATISAAPGSDLARQVARAEETGTELPMAVVIGAPEVTVMAAAAACPEGMDEFELAGAMQEKPIELIECGNLEVPAHAEIVVEGFIHPGVRVQDGPYLEYYGRPHTNPQAFLFEATRLMYRENPIFRGSAVGKAGAEDHQLFAFLAQLKLLDFHGARMKQKLQNYFWKRRAFRTAQMVARMGSGRRGSN